MLYSQVTPSDKRRAFRAALDAAATTGEPLRLPGAFNPLSARLIEDKGFEGVYVSGAVLSADLGLPDIGLTTLTEVAGRSQQIARVTDLPALGDADTGFGEPMNVARTAQALEDGVEPRVVWPALCAARAVPDARRWGNDDHRQAPPRR